MIGASLRYLVSTFEYTIMGVPASTLIVNLLGSLIAGIFLNLCFVSAIIQAKELDNKSLSTVFFLNMGISIFIYGSIFFSAPFVSHFYKLPEIDLILKVTAFSFVINA